MSENHYTELRSVYVDLIHRHIELKQDSRAENEDRRDELIGAIREIEDLLNEWNGNDDRDGHPEDEQ